MLALLAVSVLWAFSFGLIGNTLAGVDPWFLALARLSISMLVFLPFLRIGGISGRNRIQLASIGALQYGLMYSLLFLSFRFLESHEVALFTIFTPIYVTMINDLTSRRFHPAFFATAILAVAGTAIIKYDQVGREGLWVGFFIMQASNLCFAGGQIWYRNVMARLPRQTNASVFGLLYFGASVVALLFTVPFADFGRINPSGVQLAVIIYLGVIASGLGFFLWNVGARAVNPGTLAVFNNLKIPLAMAVSLLVFREETNVPRLVTGTALILFALFLTGHPVRRVGFKTSKKCTSQ